MSKPRRVAQILLLQEGALALLKIVALSKNRKGIERRALKSVKSTSWHRANLLAEPDGCVSEALPLAFESPPLTVQLGPALLETFPLLQEVGISQLRGQGRGKAILQATNPVCSGWSS